MMSLRSGLAIILSFSLATPAFAADALVESTLRKAFLQDLKDRVVSVIDINNVRIGFLLECLESMNDRQFGEAVSSNDPQHKFSPWTNCNDGIAQVRQNTRIAYPLMRQRLLLSNLLDGGVVNALLMDLWQSIDQKREPSKRRLINNASVLSRDLRVTNPLETWLSKEEIPNGEWLRTEVQAALGEIKTNDTSEHEFNSLFQKACANLQKSYMGTMEVCKFMKLRSDDSGAVYFTYDGPRENIRTLRSELNVLRSLQKDALRNFQSLMENEYKAMVQLNPYVGLVLSSTPTREDFIKAFKVMKIRSEAAVIENQRLRAEKKLDDPEKADMATLVDLMRYTPIATGLVERPGTQLERVKKEMPAIGHAEIEETFQKLSGSYTYQELVGTLETVAVAIGANMLLCWLPVSKAGRAVLKAGTRLVKIQRVGELFSAAKAGEMVEALFTPICYGVGGVAINVGFLWHDIHKYDEIYREVFASIQEEELIRDVNALSIQERAIFWSFVMTPIGSGAFKFLGGKVMNRLTAESTATAMPAKVVEKMKEAQLRFAN